MATLPAITLIGAGLVGALTATLLAQRGFRVEVFERRPDPRRHAIERGRSINLSLTERGLRPLRAAGLAEAVLASSVTMVGRMVHAEGHAELQPYGITASEVDHSVSRSDLNALLLDAAERAGATLHFDTALVDADFSAGTLTLTNAAGQVWKHPAGLLLGCDGAGSALRAAMSKVRDLGERIEPLAHGYKELGIPSQARPPPQPSPASGGGSAVAGSVLSPHLQGKTLPSRFLSPRPRGEMPGGQRGATPSQGLPQPNPSSAIGGGGRASAAVHREWEPPATGDPRFALAPHALHIWPRGDYMCIALPNVAGDFTVTLFLPHAGPYPSFATLPDAAAARRFFAQAFPEVLALMPTFDADWNTHPVGHLATLYLERWHLDGRALLLGDAAHAVVPFHGQGMNAGLEDAALLARRLAADPDDPEGVFAAFAAQRKPDADALAWMSLDNYREMRDGVIDARYLLRRELAAELTMRAPLHFMSRYRMVSFTSLPYAACVERDRRQTALLDAILADRADLAGVDLDAAAVRARAMLPTLPDDA